MARFNWPYLKFDTTQGPWPCERCGELSQFADVRLKYNRIYCKNEACRFERIIDKKEMRIVEDDGTQWRYDREGNKWQVTPV